MLTIRLFGTLEAAGSEGTVDRFPSQACASLLAILSLEQGRKWPRKSLVAEIWGHRQAPLNRLSWCLSRLRQALEGAEPGAGAAIVATRQWVSLDQGRVNVDLWAARREVAKHGMSESAKWPLLHGFEQAWARAARSDWESYKHYWRQDCAQFVSLTLSHSVGSRFEEAVRNHQGVRTTSANVALFSDVEAALLCAAKIRASHPEVSAHISREILSGRIVEARVPPEVVVLEG